MAIHTFGAYNPPHCDLYQEIVDGNKTVEGRKYSKRYQNIKAGDTIIFNFTGHEFLLICNVTYVRRYPDVISFLKQETLKKTVPCVKTMDEGIQLYENYVPRSEINQIRKEFGYGFVAFGIEFKNRRKKVKKDPYQKYLKYKSKYLKLKSNSHGHK